MVVQQLPTMLLMPPQQLVEVVADAAAFAATEYPRRRVADAFAAAAGRKYIRVA